MQFSALRQHRHHVRLALLFAPAGALRPVKAFKWIIVAYSLISLLDFRHPAEHIALILRSTSSSCSFSTPPRRCSGWMASDVVDYGRAAAVAVSTDWFSPPICSAEDWLRRLAARWWAGFWPA